MPDDTPGRSAPPRHREYYRVPSDRARLPMLSRPDRRLPATSSTSARPRRSRRECSGTPGLCSCSRNAAESASSGPRTRLPSKRKAARERRRLRPPGSTCIPETARTDWGILSIHWAIAEPFGARGVAPERAGGSRAQYFSRPTGPGFPTRKDRSEAIRRHSLLQRGGDHRAHHRRRARLAATRTRRSSSSTTARRDGTRELLTGELRARIDQLAACTSVNQGKGAALRSGIERGDRRHRDHPGRGPRVRPERVPEAARARSWRAAPTSCTARASWAAARTACSTSGTRVGNGFLTLAVEHVHEPEPDRHGDLLQGVPPRGHPVDRRSRRTASASSPRSPPRSPSSACRIYEVGISYYGRTYAEGKKIGYRDGFRAIYCILKYNLFR